VERATGERRAAGNHLVEQDTKAPGEAEVENLDISDWRGRYERGVSRARREARSSGRIDNQNWDRAARGAAYAFQIPNS